MEGCGRSKGCYRNPEGCRESYCDLVVTWVNMEKDVHFELSGDTEGWVALGFSKDKKMVRPRSFNSSNGRSTDELKIAAAEKSFGSSISLLLHVLHSAVYGLVIDKSKCRTNLWPTD